MTRRFGVPAGWVILAGLVASAVAISVAPTMMPPGYSYVSQTTSESAAQGLHGAWVARLGFVCFGLSVIFLATLRRRQWGSWAVGLHATFGALMTATAAFSHRPWQSTTSYDRTEDLLHSVAATGMGFAFALGVVAAMLWQTDPSRRWRLLDVAAIGASVVLPLGMAAIPEAQGLLQRAMFAVAYLWYAREAVHMARDQ